MGCMLQARLQQLQHQKQLLSRFKKKKKAKQFTKIFNLKVSKCYLFKYYLVNMYFILLTPFFSVHVCNALVHTLVVALAFKAMRALL